MPSKEQLILKLTDSQRSKNFTLRDLESLMSKCNCKQSSAGRGSAICFTEQKSGRILIFDAPHPQKELYRYQIKLVLQFLQAIGEINR